MQMFGELRRVSAARGHPELRFQQPFRLSTHHQRQMPQTPSQSVRSRGRVFARLAFLVISCRFQTAFERTRDRAGKPSSCAFQDGMHIEDFEL